MWNVLAWATPVKLLASQCQTEFLRCAGVDQTDQKLVEEAESGRTAWQLAIMYSTRNWRAGQECDLIFEGLLKKESY